jgi:hypothetical protein
VIGVVQFVMQGCWAKAITMYEGSLRICRELGDRHGEGQTLMNLGFLCKQQGQKERAVDLWGGAQTKLRPDSPEHKQTEEYMQFAAESYG